MKNIFEVIILVLIGIFILTGCSLNNSKSTEVKKENIILTDFPCYRNSAIFNFYEKDEKIYSFGYQPNIEVFIGNKKYNIASTMKMGIITLEDLNNFNYRYKVNDNSNDKYHVDYVNQKKYEDLKSYDISNIGKKILLKNAGCSKHDNKNYFYEDDNYKYYSDMLIKVYYDKREYQLKEAIEESLISLEELKKVNYEYYKEEK